MPPPAALSAAERKANETLASGERTPTPPDMSGLDEQIRKAVTEALAGFGLGPDPLMNIDDESRDPLAGLNVLPGEEPSSQTASRLTRNMQADRRQQSRRERMARAQQMDDAETQRQLRFIRALHAKQRYRNSLQDSGLASAYEDPYSEWAPAPPNMTRGPIPLEQSSSRMPPARTYPDGPMSVNPPGARRRLPPMFGRTSPMRPDEE